MSGRDFGESVRSSGGLPAGAGEGLKWHEKTATRVVIIVVVLDDSRISSSRT